MAKKVIVCLSLFLLLFVGAFTLDKQNNRTFLDPTDEGLPGMVQVNRVGDGKSIEAIMPKIFAPREYVRIISTDGK